MNTNVESVQSDSVAGTTLGMTVHLKSWVLLLDIGRSCPKMHFDNSWMKLCLKYKVFFLIDKTELKNKSLKTKIHFGSLCMKLSPRCIV